MTPEILGVKSMDNSHSVQATQGRGVVSIWINASQSNITPQAARRFARMLNRLANLAEAKQ